MSLGTIKTIKVFISQPMSGLSDEDVLQEREKITYQLKEFFSKESPEAQIEILDTFFDLGPNAVALDYIAKSIEYLGKADLVVFAPKWYDSRGCRVEYKCAIEYGVPIFNQTIDNKFVKGGK